MSNLRLSYGEYYHICHRGNNREALFREEHNYKYFIDLYKKYIYPIADLYAYCLLPTHFHFLLRIKSLDELEGIYQVESQIWRQVRTFLGTYTKSINKTYNRSGHLFEGRYPRKITLKDVIDVLVEEALQAGHTEPIWHASTRPAWGAVEAVLRGAALAAQADAPLYIVHMNTAGGIDQLQYAREQGVKVMGETCPQYLFFTEEHIKRPDGAKWICSPPMRGKADNERIWQGLADNTLQTVGTDHCPFFFDGTKAINYEGVEVKIPGKELGQDDFTKIPNGLPGVADRMAILWTEGVVKGRLTPNQFVAYTSTNAAKIFGLYPQKGTLAPGSDADLVIWDPEKKLKYGVNVAHQRTDYNLYEGWELQGYPEMVFLRGEPIVDGEKWLGKRGQGQFLKRKPNAEVI